MKKQNTEYSVDTDPNTYTVLFWDCYPGEDDACADSADFSDKEEAIAFFNQDEHGNMYARNSPWLELDGPDVYMIREIPGRRERRAKEDAAFERSWRREIAMEAGMAMGCDAYNDHMGY